MFLGYSSSRNVFPFFQLVGTKWRLLPSRFPLFSIYLFISAFVKSGILSNREPQPAWGNLTFSFKGISLLESTPEQLAPCFESFRLVYNKFGSGSTRKLSFPWLMYSSTLTKAMTIKGKTSAIFYFSKYNYIMTYTIEWCVLTKVLYLPLYKLSFST